jgi:CO/xanthine dehydrogenase FAD-binding subunit
MIREYFRPASVKEALALLTEEGKVRQPLGGGTSLSRQQTGTDGIVDLQDAGLDKIEISGQMISAGAMVRLDTLLAHPDVHSEVKRAIRIDAAENIRNMATLGGWLVSSDGRSLFTSLLLALDVTLTWEPESQKLRIGDWLPLRKQVSPGVLITEAAWQTGLHLAFEYVARAPKDRPLLVVAVAQWGSGRTRVALGGYGAAPIIAMDGPDSSGVDIASRDAYFEAGDQWASAHYRREVAGKLALRCLQRLTADKESES